MRKYFFVILFVMSTAFAFSETLEINEELFQGPKWQLSDFYQAETNKPFVCLIQDVHCHEQVQYITFEIIKHLKKVFGKNFQTVCVEGNSGDIDTSLLRDMADTYLKEDLSKNLMKRGLMTGAEYFDVLYPKQVRLFGVENIKLYNENLEQIKDGLFKDEVVEKEVALLKVKNENSRKIFYGKKIFQFEKLQRRYEEKEIDVEKYLKEIIKLADIEQKDLLIYSNINMFLKRQELLKKLDMNLLNIEVNSILNIIDKYLNYKEKIQLKEFQKMKNKRQYYAYFIELLKAKNLKIDSNFKHFNLYSDFLTIDQQLNNLELYDELSQFVFFAMYKSSDNVQEKEIIYLDRYTSLLSDYLNNKVSSKQRAMLNVEINEFVKRAEVRYGEINGGRIISHFNIMHDFYDTAIKRNEVMIDNLNKVASPITVLVIGGFHTEGLQELLRAKGSGYVVFTPTVKGGTKESLSIYLDRMRSEKGL